MKSESDFHKKNENLSDLERPTGLFSRLFHKEQEDDITAYHRQKHQESSGAPLEPKPVSNPKPKETSYGGATGGRVLPNFEMNDTYIKEEAPRERYRQAGDVSQKKSLHPVLKVIKWFFILHFASFFIFPIIGIIMFFLIPATDGDVTVTWFPSQEQEVIVTTPKPEPAVGELYRGTVVGHDCSDPDRTIIQIMYFWEEDFHYLEAPTELDQETALATLPINMYIDVSIQDGDTSTATLVLP